MTQGMGFMVDESRTPRVWQLAMAFGQGAGTMLATRESLVAAFTPYAKVIGDDERWLTNGASVIEFARAFGRVSAAHASRAGRCVIDVKDIEFGLKAVRDNRAEPLGQCAITGFDPEVGYPGMPTPFASESKG